ncbi:MAG: DNA adenine methylase [Planctomycetota bacterium]|nr:DNA adenine methylase [Planctomycetota bacterium]
MRYIGNKTRLLGDIEAFAEDMGATGRSVLDVFAGTAAVARRFKERGYRVYSNDNMMYSYVLQKAYVEPTRVPAFLGLRKVRGVGKFLKSRSGSSRIDGVVEYLNREVQQVEGIVFRQFTPGGLSGRQFFTPENGRRIDGILESLRVWRRRKVLRQAEYFVLLASLIEAADRVANISGVYGAYLKHWDVSAKKPLALRSPEISTRGRGHRAYREDANRLVRRIKADVLYVDPPYNRRQYAANYHVLEVLAEAADVKDLDAYEARLYGKTGLKPYDEQRSEYCLRQRGEDSRLSRCEIAFRDLIRSSRCRHIIVSYNEEGILSLETIARALSEELGNPAFDFDRQFREIRYRRFRSDAHRGPGRSYRVLEGRRRDEIHEWLFYARRHGTGSR